MWRNVQISTSKCSINKKLLYKLPEMYTKCIKKQIIKQRRELFTVLKKNKMIKS